MYCNVSLNMARFMWKSFSNRVSSARLTSTTPGVSLAENVVRVYGTMTSSGRSVAWSKYDENTLPSTRSAGTVYDDRDVSDDSRKAVFQSMEEKEAWWPVA